ncbi:beta-lactamase domain protein [Desulfatibacillum aliphaticivorans]|uniref:Beta-lactamase domain protein n=1 Tax=Desulfatibacillum aliphaticivorans TaxID=218208 RepID=B8FMW9_DESAL|nr:N-acyl homoserine lactonase family protein [Desulfatibacillum aliphaticivorans]ACL05839.1 beta-lactamase domain protein [Desulfatibacillum aliphaticivorans]
MTNSIKVHVLLCGSVRVDQAVPYREKTLHPLPWTGLFRGPENQVRLPVFAFLIEHPQGLALVDTGWHADVRTDPKKHLGRLHYMANVPDLPSGQAIHEQLALLCIKSSDLDYVVISHMDDDHVGGLKHVADAKIILINELEWKSANNAFNVRYRRKLWAGVNVNRFTFTQSLLGPFKSACDLFGDGSVMLIHAPGHSAGMTATMVRGQSQFILLTGDSAYARKSWEQGILPGITPNARHAKKSLEWVSDMSRRPNCAEVLATHDPEKSPHVIELPL